MTTVLMVIISTMKKEDANSVWKILIKPMKTPVSFVETEVMKLILITVVTAVSMIISQSDQAVTVVHSTIDMTQKMKEVVMNVIQLLLNVMVH